MMEHPILFFGAMVKAILAGHKTQTRRLIKMRDGSLCDDADIPANEGFRADYVMDFSKDFPQWRRLDCPKGKPGDFLWVRESFCLYRDAIAYKADEPHVFKGLKYKPSIFMPKWASRITLEIVSIRVQKLQEITRDDAKAEGVSNCWNWTPDRNPDHFKRGVLNPYFANYSVLWDELNKGEGMGWEDDPWVWAIEFKVVDGMK